MITSPKDVTEECELARQAVYEWNALHAYSKKIVLDPTGWKTHSAPLMGGRPQEIINKQVLEHADLLIGIFWTRIGTSTGQEDSGTVEEIKRHVAAGKPAMLYFSKCPAVPDTIDPQQYEKLQEFKSYCKMEGLFNEFGSVGEFKENFARHLVHTINDNDYLKRTASEFAKQTQGGQAGTAVPLELSAEAKVLLLESVQDHDGHILKMRDRGGVTILTNGKNMVEAQDARTVARWEGAIRQLCKGGLLEGRGDKGQVFAVTDEGYVLAETLKTPDDDLEFEKRSGTLISKGSRTRYCHKCYKSTPSKRVELREEDIGWKCAVCDKFYPNPDYKRPERTKNRYNPLSF
jgi:hypothetical protein